jgi:hypothetical protein
MYAYLFLILCGVFMLPASRPHFAEAVNTTQKSE